MGKRRGRGGSQEGFSDQYGDCGLSQDRDEYIPSKSFRGGGSAGGPSRTRTSVTYERQIPKFLQPYAHLIDKKKNPHEAPVTVEKEEGEGSGEDDNDDDGEVEAIRRAIEENPDCAKDVGEDLLRKAEASGEKEAGNGAYARGEFEKAINHFSRCIELDPRNEVYFSNRSAAYAQMKDYEQALRDAKSAIRLKPNWVKGWARLASAHFGLEEFSEAKEAYEKAIDLEPEDENFKLGLQKAHAGEQKQIQDKKHTFKRKHDGKANHKRARPKMKPSGGKGSVKLSFED